MTVAPRRELVLGGVPIPLATGARVQKFNVTQFPQKTLVGPTVTQNDHSIRTTLALSNFAGLGRQIYRQAEEGVERFWYSSLETRYHNYLTLPPLQTTVTGPGGFPGGVDWFHYDRQYQLLATNGGTTVTAVTSASPSSGASGSSTTYGGFSIGKLAEFHGSVFACENSEASTYRYSTDITTLVAPSPVPTGTPAGKFSYLVGIDSALYGISLGGSWPPTLWVSTSPAQNSAPWTKVMDLPIFDTLYGVITGYSADGFQVIYIVSGHGIWQLDPSVQSCRFVYRFTLDFRNLQPMIVQWDRTRAIYFGAGQNIIEIGPGTIRNISPFRDDALPDSSSAAVPGLTGRIASLFPMENWLGCTVIDDGVGKSSVLLWDEIGWHVLGVSATNAESWSRAASDGAYVYVGTAIDTKLTNWYAPDEKRPPWLRASSLRAYAASGSLITPWFHYDFPDTAKEADEFTIQGFNFSATETATIEYQVDSDTGSWTSLGVTPNTFTEGTTKLTFGTGGVAFYQIRFRITLARGTASAAPVIRSMGFRFVLRPKALYGWTVQVDCRKDYGRGKTAEQLKDYLFSAYESTTKLSFAYGRQATTYVLVSGITGTDTANKDLPEGQFQLTLLQVKSEVA